MGFTEAVHVAGMAEAFNLRIANGNGAGPHNLHLIAGVPNGWQLEFHYHNWMMYEAVYSKVPRPERGWVKAPETPGLGIERRPEV